MKSIFEAYLVGEDVIGPGYVKRVKSLEELKTAAEFSGRLHNFLLFGTRVVRGKALLLRLSWNTVWTWAMMIPVYSPIIGGQYHPLSPNTNAANAKTRARVTRPNTTASLIEYLILL